MIRHWKSLNKAIELDNSDETALISKSKTLKNMSKYAECIDCIGKVLNMNPLSADAWEVKGDAFIELDDYEEAVNCYSKATEIEPRRPLALFNKGRSLGLLGKYEESIECFDRIIEFAIVAKTPIIPRICFLKGQALHNLGRYEEAIQILDKGLEMKSPIEEDLDEKADALILKGDALSKLKRHPEALECYNVAIEMSPSNPITWVKKTGPLNALHHYKEALDAANKAKELGLRSKEIDDIIMCIEVLKEHEHDPE
jgi:tetratricopeptide (TPR) repeat protein